MACILDTHPDRTAIDAAIIAGAPTRHIAAQYNVAIGTAHRHKQCIKDALKSANELAWAQDSAHGSNLLESVQKLASEAIGILETAKAQGNLKAACSAICAAVRVLELTGRLDGSLAQPHAPGLHLTLNQLNQRVTNVSVNSYDNDFDFAVMVGEATRGFSIEELMRLKALVDSSGVQDACKGPVIALNPKP